MRTALKSSATERCLAKFFVPCILSKIGRIIILIVYVILIAGSIYGCS